jgi:predicted dehydrogenase
MAGVSSAARFVHAADNHQIKVALIGCGGRGTGAAGDLLSASHPVKIWALADMFSDRLNGCYESLAREHGDKVDVPQDRRFTGFDGYQQAIDSGVDMVILATPPGFRPMQFEAAVKAGKHVFMEKPVATDPAGVRTVLAAAEEAKKKKLGVGVGLQRRHQQSYIDTIKRIHDGAIGDIVALRVYWNGETPWVNKREDLEKRKGSPLTEMEYQLRNWYYFVWLCGDHINEQHIHNLDVGNWVKNAYPVKANGMGGCQVRKGKDYGEIFDHHAVEFEFADGSRMYSQCRHIPHCWNSVSEYAHGTKGTANISGHSLDITGGEKWRFKGNSPNPYRQEHQDLLDSIAAGNPINEGEQGAMSTMTALLGRMCTYSGSEISMQDALHSQVGYMPKEFSMTAMPQSLPGMDGMYNIPMPGITKVM